MSITPFEQGTVAREGQGPYAPETLLSDAYSRRFVGTPLDESIAPFLAITDYYAVVNAGTEEEPVITIQNCTEQVWCTDFEDVGGTEVISEYTFEDGSLIYTSVEAALRDAIQQLEGWDLDFWSGNFRWVTEAD